MASSGKLDACFGASTVQILEPKSPGFSNVKQLMRRMDADRRSEQDKVVSVDDVDVPPWQRQTVWSADEMGLLAYSIIRAYPIGIVILWQKSSGIRVPIDGRQRLTAIKQFFNGAVAIPDLPSVEKSYRKKKFKLQPGDADNGYGQLSLVDRENFEDYQLNCVEYQGLSESTAMDIFVMLQGGKPLTKTEVRAALGGELCDFITELTSGTSIQDEESEEEVSKHEFFQMLAKNMPNQRKAHRNMADIMVHEIMHPGEDKHWSSLENLYRDKAHGLSNKEKTRCRSQIKSFLQATTATISGKKVLIPQLKSAHFILTVFRAWQQLDEDYDFEKENFAKAIQEFETRRQEQANEVPWINFTSSLSNAGYAKNRINTRHEILLAWLINHIEDLEPKDRDGRRGFTEAQKLAIWERACHQCEWVEDGSRCAEEFNDYRTADADHIVRWKDNGKTTIANGRLLCQRHNRGRRD
ncbi:MAG: DUF262 domain-containing protein [Burkholderiales bacterium]|nr:MAG: DUF262 domain-containing protein [Burkholderiales bacterium]